MELMGLFSAFKKRGVEPVAAAELYRKTEGHAAPLGEDLHGIRAWSGKETVIVPSFIAEFLANSVSFAPLEEHIAEFAEYHELDGLQVDGLRSWLPRLLQADLLIS